MTFDWTKFKLLSLAYTFFLAVFWLNNFAGANGYTTEKFTRIVHTREQFDRFSADVVEDTIFRRSDSIPDSRFMYMEGKVYYSQFGLQADIGALLLKLGWTPAQAIGAMNAALVFLSGLSISLFFAWVSTRLSLTAGIAGTLAFAFGDWPIFFSAHIYWFIFLFWLAFSLPWLVFQRWGLSAKAVTIATVCQFVIVLLRCLCGYEFVTILALAPLPALLFFASQDHLPWKKTLRIFSVFFVISVAAFGCAMLAHWGKGIFLEKMTLGEILDPIVHRMTYRLSYGPEGGAALSDVELKKVSSVYQSIDRAGWSSPFAAGCFMLVYRYVGFLFGNIFSFGRDIHIPLYACVLGTVITAFAYYKRRKSIAPQSRELLSSLALSTVGAFVASLSWWVLAVNHTMQHVQYNLITLYMAFIPVGVVFLTCFIISVAREMSTRKALPVQPADGRRSEG